MQREPRPISRKIRMISNKFKEIFDRQLLRVHLTSSQMDILIYLACHDGQEIHQREIERWFQLKNPTVTGLLNRLEDKGLVRRQVNEADKRYRVIELTARSRTLLGELREEVTQMDDRIYRCLSEEEEATLTELLDRILQNLPEFGQADPEERLAEAPYSRECYTSK